MTLVVELAPEQLCVRAIHRLLHDLGSVRLRDALAPVFEVRDAGPNEAAGVAALEAAMRREGALGLVDADGLALLVPTAALDDLVAELPRRCAASTPHGSKPACSPRCPGSPSGTATTPRPLRRRSRRVRPQAAVLLRPVDVDTIRAAAAAGVRMPEKTTFFSPKPRTGMVFRSLDR